jgi:hypothetical protein
VFGTIGLLFVAAGLIPGTSVVLEFLHTGLISRIPSVILAAALALSGLISGMFGLVLHTIARRFQELDLQMRVLGRELSDTNWDKRK